MENSSLELVSLTKANFEDERRFQFTARTQTRRLKLSEVLPTGVGLSYAVIITEMSLFIEDFRVKIEDFDSLFSLTRLNKSPENLQYIRNNFQILEGGKKLSERIALVLSEESLESNRAFIRCWWMPEVYCWSANLAPYLYSPDLLEVLPHSVGEFEVFDLKNTWYMWLADVDPFIFLAAAPRVISSLVNNAAEYIMELPGTFNYS